MDTRRLLLLMVFSFSLVMLWDAWGKHKQPKPQEVAAAASRQETPQPSVNLQSDLHPAPAPVNAVQAYDQEKKSAEKILIETDLYSAEISTMGGDITGLTLNKYASNSDKNKPFILLDQQHNYAAQSGLIGEGLPNHRSKFTVLDGKRSLGDGDVIELRLAAEGANQVKVVKTYVFKRASYQIEVKHDITNGGSAPLATHTYYQLQRDDETPAGESAMVRTFTGPAIYTDAEKYQKIDFSDISKDKAKFTKSADNGWLGMVQHYFVSAWVPHGDDMREFYARQIEGADGGKRVFSAGLIMPVKTIEAGESAAQSITLYAGPQIQADLKKLAPGLDLVVDYGWLTLVAAPIFWILQAIHTLVGNWGWAIIILTVAIKGVFFPLSATSYRSMAKMRTVTPRLTQLKERFGDDRQRLNQEMMKLYQSEKINPLGGCLPILVQIPVFIALYWVLLGAVEMRGAPWLGWISDLSSPDTMFGVIPGLGMPIGLLPILMVISMIIQTKLNPTPPDPIQAKVMTIMPFAFGIMFFWFPSGLVLYWVVNNVLSIAQQWQITRMIERGEKKPG